MRTAQGEFSITSKDRIEQINRQFHMQVLFSLGMGNLKEDSGDSVQIFFYNSQNKEMKGFGYNPGNKKVYPGELGVPPDTQKVLDQIVRLADTKYYHSS
ncbi:hypothetical protein Ami103574_03750 [Aminipila butyrica]|uniref:Uncharacterized protein n=1 Tax=Aminipila butyrica TaxID=433296 RepID=A0A858BWN1_9FIRM|nr:hypothetical protein [Aminipila butyrica]QIB68486.1 hypothetical protein Ami103574_03750 [Aminipila butyrica]